MSNLKVILVVGMRISLKSKIAWLEYGAIFTIGQIYNRIAKKSKALGFPIGVCPMVGVGGHFTTLVGKLSLTETEMSWIDSILYFAGIPIDESLDVLLDRTPLANSKGTFYDSSINNLIPFMQEQLSGVGFPELRLTEKDCTDMYWIDSILYFACNPVSESLDVLLDKTPLTRVYFKAKSNYVKGANSGIWIGRDLENVLRR
ncbi:hypothetical protein RHSIM_Rhsim02G0165600 [Rhododendron simsii]|uniref:Uncharacterized protein n=1 Tax=Rhododendron simsii TaxID=118357 RepID=A0A834H9M9_RHOSS|nr:hypothetical protein RHSIM_Rhsim02G0165600 [Rhododendron simsii]